MFNLIAFFGFIAIAAGLIWLAVSIKGYLNNPHKILAREAEKLSVAAAKAASAGNYAERDRLDDARNAILTRLSGKDWEYKVTDHDDPSGRYFK